MKTCLLRSAFGLFALLALPLLAQANLLENSSFDAGDGRAITRWTFPKSILDRMGKDASFIDWSISAETGGDRHLVLSTTALFNVHFWIQQEAPVTGGTAYRLTLRSQGQPSPNAATTGEGFASADIGLYFLDLNGKWIGYQRMPDTRYPMEEWKDLRFDVTTPDNAVRIGVRIGLSANIPATARFDDIVLREAK
jgi:hypothetical protein